jgi:lambda repressor-like predicted transcriptional regulator
MHPEQIKAAIRMKGTTPSVLAEELGIAKATMSQVIHGRGVSSRVSERISKLIGVPVKDLWPTKPSLLRRKKSSVKVKQPKKALGVTA